jgi:SAM-dependent methyltransferase
VDPDEYTRVLAAESLATGDPTGWFERLYAAAQAGDAVVPWDRGAPSALLAAWAERGGVAGAGRSALVVGAGFGRDAEFVAGLGFDTTAFDVSATAIGGARERHAGSPVHYQVADLLAPPPDWRGRFDLVVESMTVQAFPDEIRPAAIAKVGTFVAPGGTLIVVAAARGDAAAGGPPWPLTRAEIDAFATGGLDPVRVEDVADRDEPTIHRWRAEFRRPA